MYDQGRKGAVKTANCLKIKSGLPDVVFTFEYDLKVVWDRNNILVNSNSADGHENKSPNDPEIDIKEWKILGFIQMIV